MKPTWIMMIMLTVASMTAPQSVHADTAHDFRFDAIDGGPLPLDQYAGQAVLLVNTASRCGFTRQYTGLQQLWSDYRDKGLVVLGIPSNDFGGQEPGTEAEIKAFCEVNFDVDFPMTTKTTVRGEDAHPFFQWVKQTAGAGAAPRWNFHKYLVGRDGQLVAWFPSAVTPASKELISAVETALR